MHMYMPKLRNRVVIENFIATRLQSITPTISPRAGQPLPLAIEAYFYFIFFPFQLTVSRDMGIG